LTDRGHLRDPDHPLVAFRSSPESVTPEPALPGVSSGSNNLPCGFLPLRRFPGTRQPLVPRIPTLEYPCPLSVSHALRALLHPVPAGLVSCRSRPWGYTLQGSSHPRSRTPSRTPLPSCGCPSPFMLRHPAGLHDPPGAGPLHPTAFLLTQPLGRRPPLQGLAPRERPFLWPAD
jgi:hypothetical protein